ncbi:hypothetical protein BH20BAC1_BH20BAC1_22600 [soil metagenome]
MSAVIRIVNDYIFRPIFAFCMKKFLFIFIISVFLTFLAQVTVAQCSICSKSVQQMGDKPAKGFNTGIIYMMLVPYIAIGVVGYKWWKSNRTS